MRTRTILAILIIEVVLFVACARAADVETCERLARRYARQCVATPKPSPSPTPRATPTPGGEPCPDGFLTVPASKTDPWFGVTTDIPEGMSKRFCARVTGQPWQIVFSWYDVSDQDCAAVNVRVDAPGEPARPRGGDGFSASGSYVYYGRVGSRLTPEQVQPGDYVITLTGGPSSCNRFRVAWRVW